MQFASCTPQPQRSPIKHQSPFGFFLFFFYFFFYFLVDRRPEGNPILHTSRNLEAQLFGQLTNTGAVNCDCQPANSGALEASSHANYSAMCDALRELNSIL